VEKLGNFPIAKGLGKFLGSVQKRKQAPLDLTRSGLIAKRREGMKTAYYKLDARPA